MTLFKREQQADKTAQAEPSAYDQKKQREAARQREQSAKNREIAPVPAVADKRRRAAAVKLFRKFCEVYFPNRFKLKWSPDHLEVLADLQRIVTSAGVLAVAMPRGSGKTSLAEAAVLWAVLCRGHRYVMLIAATKQKAKDLLQSIRTELESNELLLADFPEVCYPVSRLEGINQRRLLHNGKAITVKLAKTEILLPQLDKLAAGAVIRCAGLLGGEIRGASYVLPDGTRIRPSFFVADDPQTDGSAKSEKQSEERERILAGAVLGMAGPGQAIAGIVPCTVIRPNDMADRILNRELHPEYHGRRYKLLKRMPAEKDLAAWREYGDVRAQGLRADDEGTAGNLYYKKHRSELEKGTEAAWPERYLDHELSAIHHAINLYLADRRSFYAEYQNDPAAGEETDARKLDPDQLIRRTSGYRRGVVPASTASLSAGIDVQKDLLYWSVLALEAQPTGYVIDYGTWPEQRRRYFSLRDAGPTIEQALKKKDNIDRDGSAQLWAALDELIAQLTGREFAVDGGGTRRIGKIVIDAGYLTDVVFRFCKASSASQLLLPSKGSRAFSQNPDIRSKAVLRWGEDYFVPRQGRRPVLQATIDSNAWITRVHEAFLAPQGAKGAWTLHDDDPQAHRCFADHITAELCTELIDKRTGRLIRQWRPKPGNPDNHWLDSLKLAGVGGFELGCKPTYQAGGSAGGKKSKRAPKVTYH